MKSFFNLVAPVYEKFHFGARKTFRKIETLADFQTSDVVVDLGGGTGRIAKFLVGKVQSITVIDVSEKMIEQCKKHFGLSCVIANGENLPIADNSVDRIILVDAFHHTRNQAQVIKEIKRILKSDGKIIIEEFNPSTILGKLIIILEKILKLGSAFHSPLSLENLFSSSGFSTQLFDAGKTNYHLVARKPALK